jgi:hypothetical protein
MNNGAMNVTLFLHKTYIFVSLECVPRNGIAKSYGNSLCNFSFFFFFFGDTGV